MSAPESTVPEEFNDIFRQGVLVVGGHAVNLWASYYAHRGDRQLAAYAPFVSKDADIHLRDKEMAMGVAACQRRDGVFGTIPKCDRPFLARL